MPSQPKPRKPGRPKLPKGEAKGKAIGLRLSADEVKSITAAAKEKKQTVSEWIAARWKPTAMPEQFKLGHYQKSDRGVTMGGRPEGDQAK